MPATWVGLGMSALGMGLNFFAGKKQDARYAEMAEAQWEADKLAWNFDWQETQDAYAFAIEDLDIAKWNLEQQRIFRDQTAVNEWVDKDRQRLFDYNNQVQAYNASVKAYGTQLDFNNIADELTRESAVRGYQDKLTSMGFQLEGFEIDVGAKERDIALRREGLNIDLISAKTDTKTGRDKLRQALYSKQTQLNADLGQQRISGLEEEGQVRARGQTGRSARKSRRSAISSSLRLEQALFDSWMDSEKSTALDIRGINEKLENLSTKLDLNDVQLLEDLYNTRVDQEFSIQQMHEQLRSTNLAYEQQKQQTKLNKYQADVQAQGMIASKPILAPQLAKPLKLPTPVLQKPRPPRQGPEPQKYVAHAGHGIAGLATGMQSFGSALASANFDN